MGAIRSNALSPAAIVQRHRTRLREAGFSDLGTLPTRGSGLSGPLIMSKLMDVSAQTLVDVRQAIAEINRQALEDVEGLGDDVAEILNLANDGNAFWGYDANWLTTGTPSLTNIWTPGAQGTDGHNVSFNNNQFWTLTQECTEDLFVNVIFQVNRYAAAQIRLKRLLRGAPEPALLQSIEAYLSADPTLSLETIASGQSPRPVIGPRDAGYESWKNWCLEVLHVIGAARWASGFSWSNLFLEPKTVGTWSIDASLFDGTIAGPDDDGNRYLPDLGDAFGCPYIGYVSPVSNYHRKVVELIKRRARYIEDRAKTLFGDQPWDHPFVKQHLLVGLLGGGPRAIRTKRPDLAMNGLAIAPKVLGLKRTTDSHLAFEPVIPTTKADFEPFYNPVAILLPKFLALKTTAPHALVSTEPSPNVPISYSVYLNNLASAQRIVQGVIPREFFGNPTLNSAGGWTRDQVNFVYDLLRSDIYWGVWEWRGGPADATYLASQFSTLGATLHTLMVAALAQDIVETTHADLVVQAFADLENAILAFPPQFQGSAARSYRLIRAAADETVRGISQAISGIGSVALSVASAVSVYAAIAVAVVVVLTYVLVNWALDIGIIRAKNPPVLPSIAFRTVPRTSGEERCDLNLGKDESLSHYYEETASIWAETARRYGGQLRDMFRAFPDIKRELLGGSGLETDPPDPPKRTQNRSMLPWLVLGGVGVAVLAAANKK